MGRKGTSAFHRSTICPKANSSVKQEMEPSMTRSKTNRHSTALFSQIPSISGKQWTVQSCKESRTRVKVGNLPI